MNKYVITSDWHIGSEVCQRDKIIDFLRTIETEVLILNGDIIDANHLKRLTKKDWKILSLLRKLSKNIHIVYIRGNHDSEIAETISDLLGFRFCKEYDFKINNIKYHITHGDYFDLFISKYPLITEIATGLYYWIQRFSTPKQIVARAIKKKSKNFIKCCDKIRERAVAFCQLKGYDKVVCGHTHQHFQWPDNYPYINIGCFTEAECSYVTIDEYGTPQIVLL